jgi:hypothetical protein
MPVRRQWPDASGPFRATKCASLSGPNYGSLAADLGWIAVLLLLGEDAATTS